MEPLIPVNSELVIEKIDSTRELKKFDIVVFLQDNQLFCHYVWHVNVHFDKGLIGTRSLKYNEEDHPFDRGMIIGVVKNFKINFLTKVLILVKNRKA